MKPNGRSHVPSLGPNLHMHGLKRRKGWRNACDIISRVILKKIAFLFMQISCASIHSSECLCYAIMEALQEACLCELRKGEHATSGMVMSGKLGPWLPRRTGRHLSALHADVAQLLVPGVPKLTLQLVDRSEHYHLPAIVSQFGVREAAQAPVKGMQRSEDACATAKNSRMMQHCSQSCRANAITHTL